MSNTIEQLNKKIEAAIEEGKAIMRPRWYFVIQGVLAVLGGVLIALVLLYLISFIVFTLKQNGVGFVPAFGPRGWLSFARNLPWLMILFSLLFIGLLELFVRRYAFSYRRPALYSALGIICLAVVGGFFLAQTELHPRVIQYSFTHHLPVGEAWYQRIENERFNDIFRGIIVATTSSGFIIEARLGTSSVVVGPTTRLIPMDTPMPGSGVIILGDVNDEAIHATGIRFTRMRGDTLRQMPHLMWQW